ncbi:MAG: HTTM domain-containing protein [Planctomycetes bacterium]|nr:HTTM domain-containing protein [Planctomycetota bacterium]
MKSKSGAPHVARSVPIRSDRSPGSVWTNVLDRPLWNDFWFAPSSPHTLAMLRILGGAMLFYSHAVWTLDLQSFLGPNAWISTELSREMNQANAPGAWSLFWHVDSAWLLWLIHIAALVVYAMLTAGLFTRTVAVLAWILTLSYCHRLQGALYGLDQVNALLATYLMLGPSGAVWSIDSLRAARRDPESRDSLQPPSSAWATVAVRLVQIHMCVIYFFGGISKLKGTDWWDGSALWMALSNYDYQSLDLTWLIRFPALIALLTHLTVIWETFYCVLVWPRATRWIMLAMAVMVHGGIAVALGMPTFGLAMLIGNLAFVPSPLMRAAVEYLGRRWKWLRIGKSATAGNSGSSPANASRLASCSANG